MINKHFKSLLTTGCVMAAVVGSASAGGFNRGTADTDIIFEQGNFNMRASATIVTINRKYTANPANTSLIGVDHADTFVVPSAAVKFSLFEDVSCAGTAVNSFGAASTFTGGNGLGDGSTGKTDEDFYMMEYGATCGYKFDMSKGRFWVLGGVYMESLKYDVAFQGGILETTLKDNNVGWRAGVAYEIPEIALRAQVMYRSGVDVNATGSTRSMPSGTVVSTAAYGTANFPQSVDMKLQSGIAPGWLAYTNIKWTDWSNLTVLNFSPLGGGAIPTRYFWRDGWTVTAGVGHAFNEQVSGTAFVTWDRGVSTGFDLAGDQYTAGVGASLKDSFGGELRLGAAATYLKGMTQTLGAGLPGPPENVGRATDNHWAFAFSGGYSVKW